MPRRRCCKAWAASLLAHALAARSPLGSNATLPAPQKQGRTRLRGQRVSNDALRRLPAPRAPDRRRRLSDYTQLAKLTVSNAPDDAFGASVAIAGDFVVIGAHGNYMQSSAPGAAYIFRTTDGGATYDEVAKLTAADAAASDQFGISVAIDGATVVVGANYDDDGGSGSGSAYVFDANALPALGSDSATRVGGSLLALLVAARLAL